MSRDREENFSIKVNTDIYEEYDMNMPYFQLQIATIREDNRLIINYDYRYDLDKIEDMENHLNEFEEYFEDIDIDKLVYVETYYCIPDDTIDLVERVYQSPKYTEEQINQMDEVFYHY
jgi:hypothetical protein